MVLGLDDAVGCRALARNVTERKVSQGGFPLGLFFLHHFGGRGGGELTDRRARRVRFPW